jgi:hypothetical protein
MGVPTVIGEGPDGSCVGSLSLRFFGGGEPTRVDIERLVVSRGTEGSNPSPSSGESDELRIRPPPNINKPQGLIDRVHDRDPRRSADRRPFRFRGRLARISRYGDPKAGQTVILIDPLHVPGNRYFERIESLFEAVVASGVERLPAERRYARRERSLRDGVVVTDRDWAMLQELLV